MVPPTMAPILGPILVEAIAESTQGIEYEHDLILLAKSSIYKKKAYKSRVASNKIYQHKKYFDMYIQHYPISSKLRPDYTVLVNKDFLKILQFLQNIGIFKDKHERTSSYLFDIQILHIL